MTAWGISFTPSMQEAIEQGRKTVMRRVVRQQPDEVKDGELWWGEVSRTVAAQCPYTGPELCVKERLISQGGLVAYRTDGALAFRDGNPVEWPWRNATLPARFMPRWATRTRLVEVKTSIEQLGDISEADAWAEGVRAGRHSCRHEHEGRELYRSLWENIHGPGSWVPSLWVWRIEFKVETTSGSRG